MKELLAFSVPIFCILMCVFGMAVKIIQTGGL